VRPALAWVVPDLALVSATVTLFYCLFLSQGYQQLFRDSDAGWHIRSGELILHTGALPRTDPFSFTRAGAPWFAWEWGSDVIMGAIDRAAGLRGVALFYGAVIAATVWLWFGLHWALKGDFLGACVMAPLMLTTCGLHWLARPHVIGWVFLLLAVWWAETASRQFGWAQAAVIVVFTALWANFHASFFLAPVIALIYRRPWAALVAAVAPLANPYGWRLYEHVIRYLTDSELLARIGEFQSFDFHTAGSWQIIAGLLLGICGGALAFTQRRYDRFLLAMLLSAMALRSARALPLAALVLLPLANAGFGQTKYSAGLRLLDARWRGYALVPLLLLAAWAGLGRVPVGFPRDQFPVEAYPRIPSGARLFAPDKFGGYLIYRSSGAFKVFFDGRSDLYGGNFLKDYGRMVQVRPGWQEIWERYGFTHALLPLDAPLSAALEERGWRRLYTDRTVIILSRT
jgi:hypothetical protein